MKKTIITTLGIGVLLYLVGTLLYIASAKAQDYSAPRNFHEYAGAMKGTVPGFAKKPKYFDSRLAEEQLRFLYNEKGVRLVISLDHCENVKKVIIKINKNYPGVGLEHVCRKIVRGQRYYERNITLFEEIASAIGSVTFYIHCRYGAHRAVTALTGGWIAKQKLTFKEAFENAGGKKRNFRKKGSKQLLQHAKRYARDMMEPDVQDSCLEHYEDTDL
tara:strand:- start:1131 stop:1781 length:651 start_codon:yes stop_codon:yes gene_type:complete